MMYVSFLERANLSNYCENVSNSTVFCIFLRIAVGWGQNPVHVCRHSWRAISSHLRMVAPKKSAV